VDASDDLTQEGRLAERLHTLRTDAGLTGDQLAELLHWARSKVSKLENVRQVPTVQDVRVWAAACGHPEETDDLTELVREVRSLHQRWQRRLKQGQAVVQRDVDELTRAATLVRNVEPMIVPGLLQTAGYARSIAVQSAAIWGTSDIDATVQARMDRAQVLYDTAKTFVFIVTEAALRLMPCPRQVMLGQLDRLLSMDLENVTLGIIPLGRELPMTPYSSFLLLDNRLITESFGDEDQGEAQSEAHIRIFDMLMQEAVTGDDARRLIMAAAADLRGK
jgi:transcriptional regulator with XRE-family HTH domain